MFYILLKSILFRGVYWFNIYKRQVAFALYGFFKLILALLFIVLIIQLFLDFLDSVDLGLSVLENFLVVGILFKQVSVCFIVRQRNTFL